MASDPLEMLENNADLTKIYDFDLIDFQKKKEFVEAVFSRQRNHIEWALYGWIQEFFSYVLEKAYREHRHKMVSDLKGKFNFQDFKCYFASFFTFEDFSCQYRGYLLGFD